MPTPTRIRRAAATHRAADRLRQATDVLIDGVAAFPGDPWLWFDLAGVLLLRGATEGAVEASAQACAITPGDGLFVARHAHARAAHGDRTAARTLVAAIRDADLPDAAVWREVARVENRLGAQEARVAALRRAVALAPDDVAAAVELAVALERSGDRAEAREVAEAAHARAPDAPGPLRVLLRVAHHDGRLDDAIAHGAALLAIAPDGWLAQTTHLELARVHHARGDAERAHPHAAAANEAALAAWIADGHDPEAFLHEIDAVARFGDTHPAPPVEADTCPAFVIGFPRSGTTLVGRLLDSHPALSVIDEAPLLHEACRTLGLPTAIPDLLRHLPDPDVRRRLRAVWWERARAHGATDGRVVHKLPLNLVRVDVLRHLWPDAPFLCVVRDPRDAVVSAFLQDFTRNAAMARLCRLADAADLYDRAMTAWVRAAARPGCRSALIRYEAVVAQPRIALAEALALLDVPWHDDVMAWRSRARVGAIHTPSYRAVQGALTRRAIGRWQPWARTLAPHVARLDPWVVRWGYGRPRAEDAA